MGSAAVDFAVAVTRRARPTIRCLVDDLNLELPGLDVDLEPVMNFGHIES